MRCASGLGWREAANNWSAKLEYLYLDFGLGTYAFMKRATVVVLFAGGLVFAAALIGLLFFSWTPATLRIAVGPPGSDDVRVVQEIAQGFSREWHYVRLQVVITADAAESVAAIGRHEVDLAVVRADLNLPSDALSVAIFRKNLVVLWLPNGGGSKGQKKEANITKVANLSGRQPVSSNRIAGARRCRKGRCGAAYL